MAKRVAGVTEKLMECAKEEFLANGYENASLLMYSRFIDRFYFPQIQNRRIYGMVDRRIDRT